MMSVRKTNASTNVVLACEFPFMVLLFIKPNDLQRHLPRYPEMKHSVAGIWMSVLGLR